MMYWAALGMFFKAASWSIAFIFLAKGTKSLIFWNELISKMYLLGFNLLGYYLFGLKGLGISFMLVFFVYLIQVYVVSKIKFSFAFDNDFVRIFAIQFSMAVVGFLTVNYLHGNHIYIIGVILVVLSSWYSYRELDKRLGINILLASFISKDR